jgi:NADH:ubiquinone oxidoreductase subunit 4 (subunit M)
VKRAALVFSLVTFLLSLALWAGFRADTAEFQYLEQHKWVPVVGATVPRRLSTA